MCRKIVDTFPNNKYWLYQTIKKLGFDREVQNYQVRYKFIKNTRKLKYLIVKVKFSGFSVRMKIYS